MSVHLVAGHMPGSVMVFCRVHSLSWYRHEKTKPQMCFSLFLGFSWERYKHNANFSFQKKTRFTLWMHLSPCTTCFLIQAGWESLLYFPWAPSEPFWVAILMQSPLSFLSWQVSVPRNSQIKYFPKNLLDLLFPLTTGYFCALSSDVP